jgi:hypothetical protein
MIAGTDAIASRWNAHEFSARVECKIGFGYDLALKFGGVSQ